MGRNVQILLKSTWAEPAQAFINRGAVSDFKGGEY